VLALPHAPVDIRQDNCLAALYAQAHNLQDRSGPHSHSVANPFSYAARPILAAPTNTAPASTTRFPARTSPKNLAVDFSITVPALCRFATNSPPISAAPTRNASAQRK